MVTTGAVVVANFVTGSFSYIQWIILIIGVIVSILVAIWGYQWAKKKKRQESTANHNLNDFRGQLPYDAQYVGTFQPLIGWKSKTTTEWANKQIGATIKTLLKTIEADRHRLKGTVYDNYKQPPPDLLYNPAYKWMSSAIMHDNGVRVKKFQKALENKKVKPKLSEIKKLIKDKNYQVPDAEEIIDLLKEIQGLKIPKSYLSNAFKSRSQYYQKVLWWVLNVLAPRKVMSKEGEFTLSPIGLLNLYRHYYFDLGTFLGPPIEHIWVGPASETELIEVWSQTSYRFRESETTFQLTQTEEETKTESQELSDEMQKKMEQNFKVGTTVEGGYSVKVWHVNGSLSMDYGTNLEKDKKSVRKQSRELSTKTTSEMRRSVRLLTRESTETRQENSRRHLLKNTSDKPINFEMRRKMRKVGVQAQHLGTQLCWQFVVNEPGKEVGLAELVHIAKPEDFSTTPPPDISPPSFENISEDYQFDIPFEPTSHDADDNGYYENGEGHGSIKWNFDITAPPPQPGYQLNSVVEKSFERTNPDHDPPSVWSLGYWVLDPASGKFRVQLRDVNFEKQPAIKVTVTLGWGVKNDVKDEAEKQYKNKIKNYEEQKQREAQIEIVEALRERINLSRSIVPRSSDDLREEERTILYRRVLETLLGNELTGTALYATSDLIQTFFETDKLLYFVAPDWWNPRLASERRGAIRGEESPFKFGRYVGGMRYVIFEGVVVSNDPNENAIKYKYKSGSATKSADIVDFVGEDSVPNPQDPTIDHISAKFKYKYKNQKGKIIEKKIKNNIINPYYKVTNSVDISGINKVRFGREQEVRSSNYMITEDSEPAPLGSSIGWLAQLDGDARRNAFLNAAWARVVIPIRRGREQAAIDWLKQPHVEGTEGLASKAVDEDGKEIEKTVEDAINELINTLRPLTDEDILYSASQEVYENGFDPLEGGFKPGPDPFEIFAQWVEVVPTNQVVPVEYKTQDLTR